MQIAQPRRLTLMRRSRRRGRAKRNRSPTTAWKTLRVSHSCHSPRQRIERRVTRAGHTLAAPLLGPKNGVHLVSASSMVFPSGSRTMANRRPGRLSCSGISKGTPTRRDCRWASRSAVAALLRGPTFWVARSSTDRGPPSARAWGGSGACTCRVRLIGVFVWSRVLGVSVIAVTYLLSTTRDGPTPAASTIQVFLYQ
jgi:hypothetical protein